MARWMMIPFFCFLLLPSLLYGQQAVTMEPADATVDSTVTIYFDATGGDQGLLDFEGEVYAHTGVITLESANDKDWKHVVAGWGVEDDKVLMNREGPNLYSITFHIKSFYSIQPDETVLKLAFVFRNGDGSESARAADGSDLYIPLNVSDEWGYRYFKNGSGGLKIVTTDGFVRFQPYEQGAVRTILTTQDTLLPPSHGVVGEPVAGPFDVDTTDSHLYATWKDFTLEVQKSPLEVAYRNGDTLTVLESFLDGGAFQGGLLDFSISPEGHFYGGGSRALPLNLRGHRIDFYNQAHYGYSNGTPNLNTSIPVLVNPQGYSLVFDNHHRASADIGSSKEDMLRYESSKGPLTFLMMTGDSLQQLSRELAGLTGHASLPPLWSMGYIQSRYGYENRQEAEEVVEQMQAHNFPMDALVLDLYWFGGTSRMGDFNWDRSRFPNPQEMIADFDDQGIETILITEPYFTLDSDLYDEAASSGHFAANDMGNPYVLYGFWAGDASLFDMTSSRARDWLWPHYKDLLDMGVEGLWTDLGEPESHPADMQHEMGSAAEVHNLYNNMWSRMLDERVAEAYPDKRLVNLTRSGYLGMQRWSTYPWSGDVNRSFSGLRAQIPIMLHMGMSGVGYMHSDVGGFTGGGKQPELYVRWQQMGAFSPVMRAHGTGVPPEPIYYEQPTQDRVRKAIEMRYEFLPYNYTLAWQYAKTGIPLARPMGYYHSGPDMLHTINNQYLWGKDLLVAPVLWKGQSSREVTLPEGKWADYYTGDIHEGGREITAEAPLDRIPLFLREGGFLVQSREQLPHTRAYDSDSIRIRHYLSQEAGDASAYWYHDDGTTPGNIQEGHYNLMKMSTSFQQDTALVKLERTVSNLPAISRKMEFMFYGLEHPPSEVSVNDQSIPVYDAQSSYAGMEEAAYWKEPFLYVHFPWEEEPVNIRIEPDGVLSGLSPAEKDHGMELQAEPNPFTSYLRLKASVPVSGEYQVVLYDIKGQKVAAGDLQMKRGTNRFRLSSFTRQADNLSPGVYVVVLEGHPGTARLRVLKTGQ